MPGAGRRRPGAPSKGGRPGRGWRMGGPGPAGPGRGRGGPGGEGPRSGGPGVTPRATQVFRPVEAPWTAAWRAVEAGAVIGEIGLLHRGLPGTACLATPGRLGVLSGRRLSIAGASIAGAPT